jgi:hypothetical protein
MSIWTVKPEDVRVELSYTSPEGTAYPFWVKFKKRLNVGEERRVMTAGWKGLSSGRDGDAGGIQIDWQKQTFARAEAYLTDWSLLDDDAKKLPISREVIETLNGDVYKLIETAITAHVAAVEEEKKVPTGTPSPSLTSV